MLQTSSVEDNVSYPPKLLTTVSCWKGPCHSQLGMLLTILLQNCYFYPGTPYHISGFPSNLSAAFCVHNSGSCRGWVSSICMSVCCLTKCCCTQYTHSGANVLSVIIQENEGGDLYGLTSAKETVHMKKTEHYIRLFFSSLRFFFLHFHTLTLLYWSLVQYISTGYAAVW